jgi:hypothetical protein
MSTKCYYAISFNEPNHFQHYEGWGSEDADARDFTHARFVYGILRCYLLERLC